MNLGQKTVIFLSYLKTELSYHVIMRKRILYRPYSQGKTKNGNMHTILNLKYLSKHVKYNHFQMELLSDVFKIIQPNYWVASLRMPFIAFPLSKVIKNISNFFCKRCYKYVGMLNGYSETIRIFTKILKPLFAKLRNQGRLFVLMIPTWKGALIHSAVIMWMTLSICCNHLDFDYIRKNLF